MSKSKFAELSIPASIPLPKGIAGMTVLGAFTEGAQHKLVLKRPSADAPVAAKPAKKKATRKPYVQPVQTANKQTSFNPDTLSQTGD